MGKPIGFALKDSQSGTQLAHCLFISLAFLLVRKYIS